MIKVKLLNKLTITFTDDGKMMTEDNVEVSPSILKLKLRKFDWKLLLCQKDKLVKNAVDKLCKA